MNSAEHKLFLLVIVLHFFFWFCLNPRIIRKERAGKSFIALRYRAAVIC